MVLGKCEYCGRRSYAVTNDVTLCQDHYELLGFIQFARTRGLLVSKMDEVPPIDGDPIKMP